MEDLINKTVSTIQVRPEKALYATPLLVSTNKFEFFMPKYILKKILFSSQNSCNPVFEELKPIFHGIFFFFFFSGRMYLPVMASVIYQVLVYLKVICTVEFISNECKEEVMEL